MTDPVEQETTYVTGHSVRVTMYGRGRTVIYLVGCSCGWRPDEEPLLLNEAIGMALGHAGEARRKGK